MRFDWSCRHQHHLRPSFERACSNYLGQTRQGNSRRLPAASGKRLQSTCSHPQTSLTTRCCRLGIWQAVGKEEVRLEHPWKEIGLERRPRGEVIEHFHAQRMPHRHQQMVGGGSYCPLHYSTRGCDDARGSDYYCCCRGGGGCRR